MGDHSETIQIDYDPTKISYSDLLAVFWDSHNPTVQPFSRQYMSIIFYHNDEQKTLVLQSKELEEARLGHSVKTLIVPFSKFCLAEDYHQKYYLRWDNILMREFNIVYPVAEDFIASTAAARANGYAGGYGTSATVQQEIDSLGLSAEANRRLLEIADRGLRPGCPIS